jgi:hypothetical protein
MFHPINHGHPTGRLHSIKTFRKIQQLAEVKIRHALATGSLHIEHDGAVHHKKSHSDKSEKKGKE